MGGPSHTLPAFCAALLAQGVGVQIVGLDGGAALSPPLVPDEIPIRLLPSRYLRRPRLVVSRGFRRALAEEVERNQAAIIHDHALWLSTHVAAHSVAQSEDLPFVVSPRGMLSAWSLQYHHLRKRLAWLAYQRRCLEDVAAFHATSDSEAADIRRLGFKHPIAVIPHGVYLPAQVFEPVARASRRDSPVRLLFLSRIHPKKGLSDLILALHEVEDFDWRLVVAGPDEGGHRQAMQRLATRLGLQNSVTFVGQVMGEEKWRLLRQTDLFVLPSHSESFGVAIAEALACGVPVITTKATPWQVLETHHCGWWIDEGVEPLALALRQAFDLSESQRKAMGRRGQQLILQHYTWEVAAAKMAAFYRWLAGEGVLPEHVLL